MNGVGPVDCGVCDDRGCSECLDASYRPDADPADLCDHCGSDDLANCGVCCACGAYADPAKDPDPQSFADEHPLSVWGRL